MSDDYRHKVFASRGISAEVAEARGYRRYGDALGLDPIFEADSRLLDGTYKKGRQVKRFADWVEHFGKKAPGWAMPKYALPSSTALAPMLQIRPDVAVAGWKKGHDHAGMQHVANDCPCGVKEHSEKWLDGWPEYGYEPPLTDFERDQHENGQHHRYTAEDGSPLCIDAEWRPFPFKNRREGHELAIVGPHSHVKMSKYLVTPGPHGKRWDTHPACTGDRFLEAERVFVHLEGTLKCDSLVSAREVAIDVPSVTMWNRTDEDSEADYPEVTGFWKAYRPRALTDDLMLFFDAFGQAPVIVVCDSDWRHNPVVATEAFSLRDWIRDRGLRCVVASPPEGDVLYANARGRRVRAKVGSDDFIARDNGLPTGTPDDLVVVEPRNVPGLSAFQREYARRGAGASGRRRSVATVEADIEVLHWYATHSTAEGSVKRPATTIAARLGVSDDLVYDATKRLAEAGALEIWGEYAELVDTRLVLERRRRSRDRKRRTLNLGRGHGGSTATITLRADLRPELWEPTVRDWLASNV